ncbi:hypothetical protein GKG47_23045, partial [Lactonifactor sp. BIOML-A3]|uniref:hypothetical protein n=1 Tax=unclassified Lactonifactor TaxID=2636670 RepID=UPI0012AF9ED0
MTVDGASVKWVEQATDVTSFDDSYCSHAAVPGVLSAREYSDIKSTHFPKDETIKTANANGTFLYNGLLRARLLGITTLDAFKAWMTEHNPQFLLPRAEPQTEPLPSISQQALNNLKTFQNYTYIVCQDRLHPEIEAKTKNLNRNLPLLYDTISNTTLKLDTKPGRIRNFKLSGVTRQVETTGAQLLEWESIKFADCVSVAEGTIRSNITSGYHCVLSTTQLNDYIIAHKGNSITLSCKENPSGNRVAIVVYGEYQDGKEVKEIDVVGNKATFIIPDDILTVKKCDLRLNRKTAVFSDTSSVISGIMLNAGDTALPWEPYTGATSSPSPEYPQDIQGVGVRTNNEPYGYRTDVVCRTEDDTESYTAPIYTQSPVYQGDK